MQRSLIKSYALRNETKQKITDFSKINHPDIK